MSQHSSKRKVITNPLVREAREKPTHDINKNRNLLHGPYILITQGGEPMERGRAYYVKEFEKMKPFLCDGIPNPNIVEGWIQENKKNMNSLNILAHFRVGLATYKLARKADYWWNSISIGRDIETITWKEFEELFCKIFFNETTKVSR